MKIAVTTASGNLGSTIITQLKQEVGTENVVGIARTPAKAEHLGIEIRKGDYNNKTDFDLALKGVDAVLIVSGMDHPEKRIQQHRNVIEAAKKNGVSKIVYTSIIGPEKGNSFSPIVASNRQTEKDIQNSGLQWAIGRNGLYIEPDLEYIENYLRDGAIINCAEDGKCGYTSRTELAYAYFMLLTDNSLDGKTYNLFGETITQQQLTNAINKSFQIDLKFINISVHDYLVSRKAALGDFLGTVISGIYEGIKDGAYDMESHFSQVVKRPHNSIYEMIQEFKNQTKPS